MSSGNSRASPAVSVIVVSFNTRELTLACLESVFAETKATDFELIVVDNASSDGSAEKIESRFPSVTLIASNVNVGFAAANNLAAERARGEFLLLLNPDTLILEDAIGRIIAFAHRYPEAQIWGGRTLFGDGSLNPASCFRRMTLWNQFCRSTGIGSICKSSPIFNSEFYGGWKRDRIREVDVVTGCFFLIRRALWQRLGGFDPLFFMYGEETDLCLRARAMGARPMVTPEATIVHYGGASERVVADKLVRLFKAKATLIRRHWSPWKQGLGLGLMRLLPLTRIAGFWVSAQVTRQDGASGQLQQWLRIWARRREWLSGF